MKQINQIEPLTYLMLLSIAERKSNSNEGTDDFFYLDEKGVCSAYNKEQSGRIPCLKGQTTTSVNSIVDKANALVKNAPANAELQAKYNADTKKGNKTFAQWLTDYSKTEQGKSTINSLGTWISGLLGQQTTPEVSYTPPTDYDAPKGLSPLAIGGIVIGGLALLTVIGVVIFKSVAKKPIVVQTN